ncbi:MAG TPA: aminotransferase class I/II-fold pyridoxal phosphate-dependent enzyme [Planctomycetota bacterium]|nr:aminotransferase class I/II-fold pyridoxal phosphate-dependent enzyme [Planctomycetota bacterium]
MSQLHRAFARTAARRHHLDQGNLLRSLTLVINGVSGGINLGQGVCDLDTPAPLVEGVEASIDGGDRQLYTPYAGLPELRDAIAKKLRRHNGLPYEAGNVAVCTGSSGAFFAAGMTLIEPGDEVVLFEPFYSYHWTTIPLFGARPVAVPLDRETLAFDVGALRAALGPRTRAIVVNTPGNPSGKVWTREELAQLANVLDGSDVLVLTDEVYEYMCFDGRKHVSPATVPGLAERTLTMNSFSKTFSITGWRIGFLAGPVEIVEKCGIVFDQIEVCAARPMQRGVQRALEQLPDSFYGELQQGYQQKRDAFVAALRDAGFSFTVPQGAYYVLADHRAVFGDLPPYPAVLRMIERIGVNAVPGDLFFANPDGVRCMRFQFAVDWPVLDEAMKRLRSLES